MKIILFLLLKSLGFHAEIDRRDGATNIFNVVYQGRMNFLNVLMFLEDISLHECTNYCIMHLKCHTVSYSSSAKLCELNDIEFSEFEADTNAIGWLNYGTAKRVDGGFSDWKIAIGCSSSYGNRHVTYYRSCDNPKPQQGGANCVGEEMRLERCFKAIGPVCYGSRDEDYGEFTAPKTGQTRAIRLIHQSGKLMCTGVHGGRWGCSYDKSGRVFRIFITDKDKNKIFPTTGGFKYDFDDYTINDDEIIINRTTAYKVHEGQVLKVWDGGDLQNIGEYDNYGEHCIFAYIIYEKEA